MVKSLIFLQIYSRICHIFTYRYGRKRFSPKFAVADTRRAPLPSALEGCGTQSNQRLYGLYLGEITHFRLSFLKLFYFRFSRWRNLKFFEIPDLVIFTIENQQKLRFWPKFGFRHKVDSVSDLRFAVMTTRYFFVGCSVKIWSPRTRQSQQLFAKTFFSIFFLDFPMDPNFDQNLNFGWFSSVKITKSGISKIFRFRHRKIENKYRINIFWETRSRMCCFSWRQAM